MVSAYKAEECTAHLVVNDRLHDWNIHYILSDRSVHVYSDRQSTPQHVRGGLL